MKIKKVYARKKDAKLLKAELDSTLNVDSNIDVIRNYIHDLGLDNVKEIIADISLFRAILEGKEEYQSDE